MLVCFILFPTRGCGCIERPAFPTPSLGGRITQRLGRIPPAAIYYAFKRYMVGGLTAGAVKS